MALAFCTRSPGTTCGRDDCSWGPVGLKHIPIAAYGRNYGQVARFQEVCRGHSGPTAQDFLSYPSLIRTLCSSTIHSRPFIGSLFKRLTTLGKTAITLRRL